MAVIKIDLLKSKHKPTISLAVDEKRLDALIDTGAHIPVWNDSADVLSYYFPNASATDFVTSLGGFGGSDQKFVDIWKIPVICFEDRQSSQKFSIHNALFAVDDSRDYGYDIILSSTLFDKVNYGICNKESPRYFYIDYEKDVYCLNQAALVAAGDSNRMPPKNKDGKTVIKDIITFYQD